MTSKRRTSTAVGTPSSRWLRTALSMIWEREEKWILRSRADLLAIRVFAMATCAVAFAVLFFVLGMLLPAMIPGLFVVALFGWSATRREPNIEIAWRTGLIAGAGFATEISRVRAIRVTPSLVVTHGRRSTTSRHFWDLEICFGAGLRRASAIASHPDEWKLLKAARKLASALGVPLEDRCSPEEDVGSPSSLQKLQSRPLPNGTELSWHLNRPRAFLEPVLCGAAVVATGLYVNHVRDDVGSVRFGLWVLALVTAFFFLSFVPFFRLGSYRLVVSDTELVLRRLFPVPHARRLKRSDVLGIRLSVRLLRDGDASLKLAFVFLDVIGASGPLWRLPLDPADAAWLKASLLKLGIPEMDWSK